MQCVQKQIIHFHILYELPVCHPHQVTRANVNSYKININTAHSHVLTFSLLVDFLVRSFRWSTRAHDRACFHRSCSDDRRMHVLFTHVVLPLTRTMCSHMLWRVKPKWKHFLFVFPDEEEKWRKRRLNVSQIYDLWWQRAAQSSQLIFLSSHLN